MWVTLLCLEFMSARALMLTSTQVVETSFNVTTNSPSQDYTHPDDHTSPTYDMTPEFKPFTACKICKKGSVDNYNEMLRMHERKSWDCFAQRLLICQPEHRETKKPLLAGYVSIPARKHQGHTTPPTESLCTSPALSTRGDCCSDLKYVPATESLKETCCRAVWFPCSCLIYFTMFLFGRRTFVAPWILAI